MKYITVKLTEYQANFIANVLETNAITSYEPASAIAFDFRIINKIKKALREQT